MSARRAFGIIALVHRDQVQRIVPLFKGSKGARFQNQSLMQFIIRQAGDLGIANRCHRLVGLVIN